LFIIAVVAAVVGYFASMWFWRGWIGRKHRARQLRPVREPGARLEPHA